MAAPDQITDDAGGNYVVEREGVAIAGVYPHPRSHTDWLAVAPPLDWRDSGLKRFKTRRGGVAWVKRRLQPPAD